MSFKRLVSIWIHFNSNSPGSWCPFRRWAAPLQRAGVRCVRRGEAVYALECVCVCWAGWGEHTAAAWPPPGDRRAQRGLVESRSGCSSWWGRSVPPTTHAPRQSVRTAPHSAERSHYRYSTDTQAEGERQREIEDYKNKEWARTINDSLIFLKPLFTGLYWFQSWCLIRNRFKLKFSSSTAWGRGYFPTKTNLNKSFTNKIVK